MTLNHKSAILGFAAAAAALVTPVRADPFTASGGPGSFDSYTSWTQGVLANVQLAAGTSDITSLTSSAVAYDQGWGGYDPQDNQVYIGLFKDGNLLSWVHVAGGLGVQRYDDNGNYVGVANPYVTQTFTANAGQLAAFDTALAGIDWSSFPNVSVEMVAAPLGYPGWELHVRDASFSISGDVSSDSSVPDGGTTVAMLGSALLGLVALRGKLGCRLSA